MLVVALPENFRDRARHQLDRVIPVKIVETLEPLKKKLPRPTQRDWNAIYRLRSSDGSRVVDKHPSARMHAAIAEILVASIQDRELRSGAKSW